MSTASWWPCRCRLRRGEPSWSPSTCWATNRSACCASGLYGENCPKWRRSNSRPESAPIRRRTISKCVCLWHIGVANGVGSPRERPRGRPATGRAGAAWRQAGFRVACREVPAQAGTAAVAVHPRSGRGRRCGARGVHQGLPSTPRVPWRQRVLHVAVQDWNQHGQELSHGHGSAGADLDRGRGRRGGRVRRGRAAARHQHAGEPVAVQRDRGDGERHDREAARGVEDGELDQRAAAEAIGGLGRAGEATEAWRVYHLISDGMRDTRVFSEGFMARFSERLAAEPTVLAPASLPGRTPVQRFAFAAAASLAAVALVGWLAFAPQPEAPRAMAQAQPAITPVLNVPLPSAANDYLLAHQGFSPRVSLQGMAPYVRTVAEHQDEPRK